MRNCFLFWNCNLNQGHFTPPLSRSSFFLFWEKRKVNSETLDEHNLTTNVTHLVACLPELLKNTESCISRTKPSSITPIDGSKACTFKACNYKVHC